MIEFDKTEIEDNLRIIIGDNAGYKFIATLLSFRSVYNDVTELFNHVEYTDDTPLPHILECFLLDNIPNLLDGIMCSVEDLDVIIKTLVEDINKYLFDLFKYENDLVEANQYKKQALNSKKKDTERASALKSHAEAILKYIGHDLPLTPVSTGKTIYLNPSQKSEEKDVLNKYLKDVISTPELYLDTHYLLKNNTNRITTPQANMNTILSSITSKKIEIPDKENRIQNFTNEFKKEIQNIKNHIKAHRREIYKL